MGMISKVVGLVSLVGFAAISGCAANSDVEESSPEGEIGTVSQPLINLNQWSVNANLPQVIAVNGEVRAKGTFKNNSSTSGTRRIGTVLVKLKSTPVVCATDEECDPNGGSFCLTQEGSGVQKGCFTPLAATVGGTITLAPGVQSVQSSPFYPATSGYYYSVAVMNKDDGWWCASLTSRQDPTKCARSLSNPVYYQKSGIE